jgi:site-specific DNA-methyltransferase (adenine-specific)
MKIYKPTENVQICNADCFEFLSSLPNESVDIIITDPGYSGMNNKLNFGRGRIVGNYQKKDNDKWFTEFKDEPDNFRKFLVECNRVMRNDRHIYIMFDNFSILSLGAIIREVFNVKNIIVWDKVNIGMGHYFRRRHEFVVFATKGYKKLKTKDIPDVWQIKRVLRGIYPTQKPVELFDFMLKGSFEDDFVVCDPFLGSGSSIISTLKYKGNFVGADISQKACEIANKRVTSFVQTGEDSFKGPNSTYRMPAQKKFVVMDKKNG